MSENLSTKETATRLGVIPQTVIRWIKRGSFPNVFTLNPDAIRPTYRIPISDIEAFEERREQSAQSKIKK